MRNYGDGIPIAALAAGQGALALIRTSGPSSVDLLAAAFSRPEKLRSAPGNTIVHGWICAPGVPHQRIDEVLVSVYRAPKSYTGEEGADISCHGGSASVKAVLEVLRRAGFQDALPGEFTFRAFMNGKLDLTQSESVMELVSARTGAGFERALRRLSGLLAKELGEIRALLMEVLSAAELYLDYSEDEIAASPEELEGTLPRREAAEEALKRLAALRGGYDRERLYREGALAVIAGRPNAGKSSLFNLLLREDRSIVTAVPGTTRDWIEAVFSLEGIPLRLADTAGLREEGTAVDAVEAIGMERSRELLNGADCILYVIDGETGILPWDLAFLEKAEGENKKVLAIWNKADIAQVPSESIPVLALSAKTGAGVEKLCSALAELLGGNTLPEIEARDRGQPGLGSARQKELTDIAFSALKEALETAERGEALDIIAPRLRDALNALGEITGEVFTADILEAMFSRFCVGK
ncbi:MAG: tRNA uridine-5-carboxymethylaminomethyl(34) synthesis GTPase MnmE [Treponema sp.]|jgi:tRNA modification GTPase|nr:tRNA uridine-5-carboxymethylaminomethyl(34) synthesis GTPase MnmE [Treponema sp.]